VRLVAMDMDSTLITIECTDEIADQLGLKAEVAAITTSAMRGDIDLRESLERRVALLGGLPEASLCSVYDSRLALSPGAERMIKGFRAIGAKLLLVSAGFTYFTERLRERLGFDETLANVLETENGRLTGRVVAPIVDAQAKAERFLALPGALPGRGRHQGRHWRRRQRPADAPRRMCRSLTARDRSCARRRSTRSTTAASTRC
jgi:phosphoserine phosphatase